MARWGIELSGGGNFFEPLSGSTNFNLTIRNFDSGSPNDIEYAFFGVRVGSGYASPSGFGGSGDIALPTSSSLIDLGEREISGVTWRVYQAIFVQNGPVSNSEFSYRGLSILADSNPEATENMHFRLIGVRKHDESFDVLHPSFSSTVRRIEESSNLPEEPDLTISRAFFEGGLVAGEPLTFNISLGNIGDQRVSQPTYRFELATDVGFQNILFSEDRTTEALPEGGTTLLQFITIPGSYTQSLSDGGAVFWRVRADPDNRVISERSESNNYQGGSLSLGAAAPLPDLIIQNIELISTDGALSAADTVFVRFDVVNTGSVSVTQATQAHVEVRGPSGELLFERSLTVTNVPADGGSNSKQTNSFELPQTSGNYTVTVTADVDGAVLDANRPNNAQAQTFEVSDINRAVALGEFFERDRVADGVYEIHVAEVLENDRAGDSADLTEARITTVLVTEGDATVQFDRAASVFRVVLNDPTADQTLLSYTIDDGFGGTSSANLRIAFQGELPSNTSPEAVDDEVGFDLLNSDNRYTVAQSRLLRNDTDVDGDSLKIISVTGAGSLSAQLEGGAIILTASDGATSGAFTYTIADPEGAQSQARVAVTFPQSVEPVANLSPFVSVLPTLQMRSGAELSLSELVDGYDIDGDIAYYRLSFEAGAGTVASGSGQTYASEGFILPSLSLADTRFIAGPTAGEYDISVIAIDDDGAQSLSATINATISVDAEISNYAPQVIFDAAAYYAPTSIIALTSLAQFRDADGSEDIAQVLIGDYSTPGEQSAGFFVNRATGELLRATNEDSAFRFVDRADLSSWVFQTSSFQSAEVTTDSLFIAPVDEAGTLPDGTIATASTAPEANLALSVITPPRIVIEQAGRSLLGEAGTDFRLDTLITPSISVDRIVISGDSPAFDLVNLRDGSLVSEAQSIQIGELSQWAVRLQPPEGITLVVHDTLNVKPFAGAIEGTATSLSVSSTAQDAPAPVERSLTDVALDLLVDHFADITFDMVIDRVVSPVEATISFLRDLYEEQQVKYLLSFTSSASLIAGAQHTISIDLMDALSQTVEGAGGYAGNEDGKISFWQSSKITPVSTNPGISVSIGLTPFHFDEAAPDLMTPFGFKIANAGVKIGPVKLEAGLGIDDVSYAVSPKLPFIGLKMTDDDLAAVAAGETPTPSAKLTLLNVSPEAISPAWLNFSLLELKATRQLGELSHKQFEEFSLSSTLGLLLPGLQDLIFNEGNPNFSSATITDGITGSSANDVLSGTDLNDVIEGAGGDDVLNGNGGDDVLLGGDGIDQLFGGAGNDAMNAHAHGGIMKGGSGSDDYHVARPFLSSGIHQALIFDDGTEADNDTLYIRDTEEAPLFDPLATRLGPDSLQYTAQGANLLIEVFDTDYKGTEIRLGQIRLVDQASAANRIENIVFLRNDGTFSNHGPIDLVAMAETGNWFSGGQEENAQTTVTEQSFIGNSASDIVTGTNEGERIQTNGGDDLVFAGGGDDVIIGGSGEGRDYYDGGAGTDSIQYYSARNDMVIDLTQGSAIGGAEIGTDNLLNIENVNGGNGNDQIVGDDKDNYLDGYFGDDQLFGGAGNDSLLGYTGADYLDGGTGDDSLVGAWGNDTLIGGGGNDILRGLDGDNLIYAGTGDDTIYLGSGVDTASGGEGNDFFLVDADNGPATLDGEAGTDWLRYSAQADDRAVSLDLKDPEQTSFVLPNGIQVTGIELLQLYLGDGDDSVALALPETGFDRDMIFYMGDGADHLDLDLAQAAGKLRLEQYAGGHFWITVEGQDAKVVAEALETLKVAGSAYDDDLRFWSLDYGIDLAGGAGADRLSGSYQAYDDTISGNAGNDIIDSYAGHDLLRGGTGDDTLNSGAGNDTLIGGAGDDFLLGGNGEDIIISSNGSDALFGNSGFDIVQLVSGSYHAAGYVAYNVSSDTQVGTQARLNLEGLIRIEAVTDGGADADIVQLSDEGDAFFLHDAYSGFHDSVVLTEDYVGNESATRFANIEEIRGMGGNDIIDLTSPDYSLAGVNMSIDGGEGNDVIWGSDANESIAGGTGDDTMFGGIGTDVLTGGAGADVFEFTRTSTSTSVADFDIAEGDVLRFYNVGGAEFDASSLELTDRGILISYTDTASGTAHDISIDLAQSVAEFTATLPEILGAFEII